MQLFKERFNRQWLENTDFIKKNMDGVTWLYLLVPSILFITFFLRETVFKLEYGILTDMNPYILILLILFCCSLLKSRLFIEPADGVFLIQHTAVFTKLKRTAFWYSLFKNTVLILLIYTILFPLFYILLNFTFLQISLIITGMFCCYLLCDLTDLLQRKWLRNIVKVLTILLLTIALMMVYWWMLVILSLLALICIYFFEIYAIRNHRLFHHQLELDITRANRIYTLIFKLNKDMRSVKIRHFSKRAPKLFVLPLSNKKQSTLVELVLKTIWRNKGHLSEFLILITIMLPLLIIFPLGINIVLIIFFYFGINSYLNSLVIKLKDSPIFILIRYSDHDWISALKKIKQYVVIPTITLYIFVLFIKVILF
uniref:ABC transporter permease n=1 Tax=Metasolibacillus sp. FSL K6-0083 TaxID=2921416 RepID=UPI00406CC078